jgi:hypothetical protein
MVRGRRARAADRRRCPRRGRRGFGELRENVRAWGVADVKFEPAHSSIGETLPTKRSASPDVALPRRIFGTNTARAPRTAGFSLWCCGCRLEAPNLAPATPASPRSTEISATKPPALARSESVPRSKTRVPGSKPAPPGSECPGPSLETQPPASQCRIPSLERGAHWLAAREPSLEYVCPRGD